ncbi:hypothetical protein KAV79_08330, partial [Candidatus Aerophobetes bacterium]|nr:hypothetical protein [Candidatus Aerophobetes bacterium]
TGSLPIRTSLQTISFAGISLLSPFLLFTIYIIFCSIAISLHQRLNISLSLIPVFKAKITTDFRRNT